MEIIDHIPNVYLMKNICFCVLCRAAVDAMAKRHSNDSFPVDEFSIELENQRGEKMSAFSDTDQRSDWKLFVFLFLFPLKVKSYLIYSSHFEPISIF